MIHCRVLDQARHFRAMSDCEALPADSITLRAALIASIEEREAIIADELAVLTHGEGWTRLFGGTRTLQVAFLLSPLLKHFPAASPSARLLPKNRRNLER